MMGISWKEIESKFIHRKVDIYPLVSLRILLGLVLCFGIIRFMAKGWVNELYLMPKVYFPFFDWFWLKPLPAPYLYLLFGLLALSFFMMAIGLFYRYAAVFSFLGFTYIELLDKSNYLNHYYLVSLLCFLFCFSRADRFASVDTIRKAHIRSNKTPAWVLTIFKAQLFIVYFYAGLAKLNPDWLFEALPLKIWLPAKANIPLIGFLLKETWVAYFFSWFGALYDLSIPFLLLNKKTRKLAFFLVISFHLMTWILFPIGIFPFVMIASSFIFFSSEFHKKYLYRLLPKFLLISGENAVIQKSNSNIISKLSSTFLIVYLLFQMLFPWRFLAYPGKLFWTEQGYRFSWRVMLMEKAASATFKIVDHTNKKSWEVNNYDFLSKQQEKMMASQPDMLVQFAYHLKDFYQQQGMQNITIHVDAFASLNGSISKRFIDPNVDLLTVKDSWENKSWILNAPEK